MPITLKHTTTIIIKDSKIINGNLKQQQSNQPTNDAKTVVITTNSETRKVFRKNG